MKTIEQLERENDEAVRAREAAADALLQGRMFGSATAEKVAQLQADLASAAQAAKEAQAALKAALEAESAARCDVCGRLGHTALDLGTMGSVCPVNRAAHAARS